MPLAIAVERSGNSKIGNKALKQYISATSVSQKSCPITCPFKDSGCYAELGMQRFTTHKLNRATKKHTTLVDVAIAEANAIATLSGLNPLRLHVVGDCTTNKTAKIVASACKDYSALHGMPVWTYTHAWRKINPLSFGNISVLASCETESDIELAQKWGYATAIVLDHFESDKSYNLPNGNRVIPCPQQTGKSANCFTCRLCWNSKKLLANRTTIAFAAHGTRSHSVQKALQDRQV